VDLVALRALPTAVRCREIGGDLVTLRRTLHGIVPGMRLRVRPARRWVFRRTAMIGGDVLDVDVSVRAMNDAGLRLPELRDGRLTCPAEDDSRLGEATLAMEMGSWVPALCHLLDVLEDEPACLIAHADVGDLHALLLHRDVAMAHYTAAIRLGVASAGGRPAGITGPPTAAARAMQRALRGRSNLLAQLGRLDEAQADAAMASNWLEACGRRDQPATSGAPEAAPSTDFSSTDAKNPSTP
jgi:hypothetical protein